MLKSVLRTLRNALLLLLLWLGVPSSAFHNEPIEGRDPDLQLDYSDSASPPYIYDENGILLWTREAKSEIDTLIF